MTNVRPSLEYLPLFPLHCVLLPGSCIGLRVFERRYLDLVCECGHSGQTFGVCLIVKGGEVGEPAVPASHGTDVRIEDFDIGTDGLLVLRLRGHRRFSIHNTLIRQNGMTMAEVEWCDPDGDDAIRPEHAFLSTLLETMLEQSDYNFIDTTGPTRFNHASWVSWRLAELLPLREQQRLSLLKMHNPHQRLQQLLSWIQ